MNVMKNNINIIMKLRVQKYNYAHDGTEHTSSSPSS